MKIKEAQYKKVKKFVNERISDDIYGCDECKVVIDFNKKDVEYLEMTAHSNTDSYENFHFCSWGCALSYLPKIKTDYFVSLPFAHYDRTGKTSVKELIKILKRK